MLEKIAKELQQSDIMSLYSPFQVLDTSWKTLSCLLNFFLTLIFQTFNQNMPTPSWAHTFSFSSKKNNVKMAETGNLTLHVPLTPPSLQSLFPTQRWQKCNRNLFHQVQMKVILSLFHSKKSNLQVCKMWGFFE